MAAPTAVLRSEWTKLSSVRSTLWTLAAAVLVTTVLGGLLCLLFNVRWDNIDPKERLSFDPTSQSLSGLILGQLALITFGVLVIAGEYSTGTIRASLAAVPQRGHLYCAKLAVTGVLALAVGMVTSFLAFFAGQAMLGSHSTSIGDPGVLRAVFGGGLYMMLMVLFATGVATMLRSPTLSLGILIPLFFLISPILSNVPGAKVVAHYLPDQAGSKITKVLTAGDERPYGPWTGLAIMVLWVLASLIGGYVVLKRRDA